jgi:hypothetical protein
MTIAIAVNNDLKQKIEQVVGVYKNPKAQKIIPKRILDRTVLVTASNNGYLNHLYNFKCFLDRLEMKFLVISMDELVYKSINTTMTSYLMVKDSDSVETTVSQSFRTPQFNLLSFRKIEVVQKILQLGYHVLFSDTDVAMIRDPLPYMLWGNVDYVHSINDQCEL